LSPTASWTASIKGNGTNSATSHGESRVTASAIPLASATASSRVFGFNFQLPVMNDLLSNSLVSGERITHFEINAEALPASHKRVKAAIFMVFLEGVKEENDFVVWFLYK
jgi:hypothetical protein